MDDTYTRHDKYKERQEGGEGGGGEDIIPNALNYSLSVFCGFLAWPLAFPCSPFIVPLWWAPW